MGRNIGGKTQETASSEPEVSLYCLPNLDPRPFRFKEMPTNEDQEKLLLEFVEYILYYPWHYFSEGALFYYDMVFWNIALTPICIQCIYFIYAIIYWVDPEGYECAGPEDWLGKAFERWARVDIYGWRLFFLIFDPAWSPDLGWVYFIHATFSQPILLYFGFNELLVWPLSLVAWIWILVAYPYNGSTPEYYLGP